MELGFLSLAISFTPPMEAAGEAAGTRSVSLPEGRPRACGGAAPVIGAQHTNRGPRHGARGQQERCNRSNCQTWSRKHHLRGQCLTSPATGIRTLCPSWLIYKDSLGSRTAAVQPLSRVRLFATPWTAACRLLCPPPSPGSRLKVTPVKSATPSNHLILCRPLLPLPSIFPSVRVFSNESVLQIREVQHQRDFFKVSERGSASVLPINIQG